MSSTRKSGIEKLKEKSIYKIEKAKQEKVEIDKRKQDGYFPKVIGYCRVSTQGQNSAPPVCTMGPWHSGGLALPGPVCVCLVRVPGATGVFEPIMA